MRGRTSRDIKVNESSLMRLTATHMMYETHVPGLPLCESLHSFTSSVSPINWEDEWLRPMRAKTNIVTPLTNIIPAHRDML